MVINKSLYESPQEIFNPIYEALSSINSNILSSRNKALISDTCPSPKFFAMHEKICVQEECDLVAYYLTRDYFLDQDISILIILYMFFLSLIIENLTSHIQILHPIYHIFK